jgi:Homeodomain-like domain
LRYFEGAQHGNHEGVRRVAVEGIEPIVEAAENTTPKRVSLWSRRFETGGLEGLADKPGRGRKPSIPAAKVARVITEATRPPKGKRRWSIRSMSRHAGISASSVQRIWSSNDLKPHRLKTFKRSNDPAFEAKFWAVIGLYTPLRSEPENPWAR